MPLLSAAFFVYVSNAVSLNIFIRNKEDKWIWHKLYNLCCRLHYLHDIHTCPYTDN